MAFTLQDNDGNVDEANAYTSPADMRAFWNDRGVDLSAKTDTELEVAIVKATDYMDSRYTYVGGQRRRLQGTQWPRTGITSFLRGLPPALTNATCMMANRALVKPLMPDPTFDATGQKVQESTKKVGPIEVSLKYAASSGSNLAATTPEYPEVTLMLQAAGLIASGNSGQVSRG